MKKIILILLIFVSFGNTSNNVKVKDVCKWHHEEIIGWYKNLKLFRKRHIDVSDKTKYSDTNDKTIERYLLKQKKLLEVINNSEKKLQSLSKVYHYLDCTRFEREFEKG